MKLKLTEYVEATNEEIGTAFGEMNSEDQAEFLQALEEGILKACKGDYSSASSQYAHIKKFLDADCNVQGITITPENVIG